MREEQRERIWLYAGTWTTTDLGGIGIYRYDPESGKTEYVKTVREDVVAGLTVVDQEKGILYTLDERANNPEIGEKAGGGGRIYAFRIDRETGELREINHQSSLGVMPAYLSWDSGERKGLIVCNHSSGESVTRVVRDMHGRISLERCFSDTTIAHYPLLPDGSIGEPDDVLVTPPERGIYSCLHSANLAPDGHSIIVCDRNLDRVHLVHFEKGTKKLVMDRTSLLPQGDAMKTGATPRYSAFHPSLPLVYVNCEYSPYIYILRYGSEGAGGDSMLQVLESVDIAPPGKEKGSYSPSDLCLSSDGRFLYMLYRWTDQIGVFAVDEKSGALLPVEWLQLSGQEPRGMRFSPDGRFLIVATMKSGDLTTLKRKTDGTLEECGRTPGQFRPGNVAFFCASAK